MSSSTFVLDFRRCSIGLDGEITVGRDLACEVVLSEDLKVSRQHAKFSVRNGIPTVEDLGSANGVFLNGARIRGVAPVQPGDVIRIGDERITVNLSAWAERERSVKQPARAPGEMTPSQRFAEQEAESDSETQPYGVDRHHLMWLQVEDAITRRDWEHAGELLRTQLTRVMDEVTREGELPAATQERAGRHVIDIALASGDGSWLDALFALHVAAGQPLSSTTAAILPRLVGSVRGIDLAAFQAYLDMVRALQQPMSPAQKLLCSQVESAYVVAAAQAEQTR